MMKVPVVTVDDMRDFHAKHFPSAPAPVGFFSQQQTQTRLGGDKHAADKLQQPVRKGAAAATTKKEQPEHHHHDDDDLGYYPDGVKRTLTDDEISIFRHSEVHRLYAQLLEHASEAAERRLDAQEAQEGLSAPELEDGVVLPQQTAPETAGGESGEIKEDDEEEEEYKAIRQRVAENGEQVRPLIQEHCANQKSAKKVDESKVSKAMANAASEVKQEVTQELEQEVLQEVKQAENKRQGSESRQSPTVSNNGNTRNNGPKKRKRIDEVDHHTYRRIAREMDDVKAVEVELDY